MKDHVKNATKCEKKIEKVCSENKAAASELQRLNRTATGRPSKEVHQPELLSTIVRVVEASSAVDYLRRCEHLLLTIIVAAESIFVP